MPVTKKNIFSNLIWRFLERSGAQLVGFVVTVVLARLLTPEDYGTIALISVFISILNVFVDSGLGTALVQKKDADNIDFSTVFYVNIILCVLLYIILFVVAPFLARFYKNTSLISIIRVLGITILISGIKNIQNSYVSRTLQFKKFFFSTLAGTVVAAVVGIWMAYNGFGVWALVSQQLTNLFIDTLVLWITVKWRPGFVFSFKRLKGLFSFGWKLLVSALLETVYNKIYQLVIGKKYSSEELAYYTKGDFFPNVIISNLDNAINSVLLPVMSREQDDVVRIKTMTRRAIMVSVYCMAPLMIGLAVCAPSIVTLLLTEKWLPCVPFLRIFCITYVFWPIHTANLNAIRAMGRSDLFLKLEIVKKVVGFTILIIVMWFGIKIMAYSLLLSSFLCQIVNTWPNKKLLDYGYLDQMKDILPEIVLSIAMGCFITSFNLLPISNVFKLCLQILFGALFYFLGSKILKLESYGYIKSILCKKGNNNNG